MASTFFGLNIGTSGLYTYQAAINTTAHNAANTETKGYSRQQLNTQANKPISIYSSYGMVGTGVTGVSITQVRESYYDVKYRGNASIQGAYDKKSYYMTQVENYFNELNDDGFIKAMNNFSGVLQDLSTDPSSYANRTSAMQYAQSMTQHVNSVANNLQDIQKDINTEIKSTVDRINSLSQQITMLTKQINTMEIGGQMANDLRDSRNNLVDELSTLANVTVSENVVSGGTGKTTYVVKLDDKILINTMEYNTLSCEPRKDKVNETDIDGLYDLYWSDGEEFNDGSLSLSGSLAGLFAMRDGNNNVNFKGTVADQTTDASGVTTVTLSNPTINNEMLLNLPASGSIQLGNYEVRYTSYEMTKDEDGNITYSFKLDPTDENSKKDYTGKTAEMGEAIDYKGIPYYMSKLNEFVRTFAKEFNDLHKQGISLDGKTNQDFFTARNPVTGEDTPLYGKGDAMSASNSYAQMNCLNFGVSTVILNNPNAIATSYSKEDGVEKTDLLKDLIAKLSDKTMFNQGTPQSYLQTFVADIGIYSKEATTATKGQQNILDAIETQRMSVSGVDTDEEAMNLVRFQNAYNLSAKVVQIMDELYDKLINYTGV
ncbi:MAG: flagellar hook-associated protein FlgK [bacterium]|nr:flagellar hook-associated protein FlgK [bacterium]